jgi:hypothetical protein
MNGGLRWTAATAALVNNETARKEVRREIFIFLTSF